MKRKVLKHFIVTGFAMTALFFTSCKSKPKDTETNAPTTAPIDTATSQAPTPAPVQISPDDALTNSVKDATKDFPGVAAAVSNGEITLTGNITRDKLQQLMMSLNALHPKKISNNLTIK